MITEIDVHAVRRVLNNDVQRAEMVPAYSVTNLLAFGITVLIAGDAHETLRNVQKAYGLLLEEICVMPAALADESGSDFPDWYFGFNSRKLVEASYYRKLHKTEARRQLTLIPQPLLEALLEEDPEYRKIGRQWYEEAFPYSQQQLSLALRRTMLSRK